MHLSNEYGHVCRYLFRRVYSSVYGHGCKHGYTHAYRHKGKRRNGHDERFPDGMRAMRRLFFIRTSVSCMPLCVPIHKGFGFITPDDEELRLHQASIFCHRTALIGVRDLEEDESVIFELGEGTKKGSGKLTVVAASSRKRVESKLSGTAHRWNDEKVTCPRQMNTGMRVGLCLGMPIGLRMGIRVGMGVGIQACLSTYGYALKRPRREFPQR